MLQQQGTAYNLYRQHRQETGKHCKPVYRSHRRKDDRESCHTQQKLADLSCITAAGNCSRRSGTAPAERPVRKPCLGHDGDQSAGRYQANWDGTDPIRHEWPR